MMTLQSPCQFWRVQSFASCFLYFNGIGGPPIERARDGDGSHAWQLFPDQYRGPPTFDKCKIVLVLMQRCQCRSFATVEGAPPRSENLAGRGRCCFKCNGVINGGAA